MRKLKLHVKWARDGKNGVFMLGNPLEFPPKEIAGFGCEAIQEYFKLTDNKDVVQSDYPGIIFRAKIKKFTSKITRIFRPQ